MKYTMYVKQYEILVHNVCSTIWNTQCMFWTNHCKDWSMANEMMDDHYYDNDKIQLTQLLFTLFIIS